MTHPCIPTTMVGINSNTSLCGSHKLLDTCIDHIPHVGTRNSSAFGNNINLENEKSGELDDNYGVIGSERSCHGGARGGMQSWIQDDQGYFGGLDGSIRAS